MNEPLPAHRPLGDMIEQLRLARAEEKRLHEVRLALETAILDHPDVASLLKDEGTLKIANLTIQTGYTRAWDQDKLNTIKRNFPVDLWPFEQAWKEVRKGTRWIENNDPDVFALLSSALTLKPKKPYLTIKE